jgi:hypothetical protein
MTSCRNSKTNSPTNPDGVNVFEQHRPQLRSRLRSARIPAKYQGLTLESPHFKDLRFSERSVNGWLDEASSGNVIAAAGKFETCGVGLWATGPRAQALLSAVLQEVLIRTEEEGTTGLYLNADDYLDWSRPRDEDAPKTTRDRPNVRERSVLVLSDLGPSNQTTDWSKATVRSLLTRRFEDGLPTLVAAHFQPTEMFSADLAREMFHRLAIMETSG